MADKAIGELPQVDTVQDDTMIPLEQNGKAGRMSGEQLRLFFFKEVKNISVETEQFVVTFMDNTSSTYNYTTDSAGRMTGITRVM